MYLLHRREIKIKEKKRGGEKKEDKRRRRKDKRGNEEKKEIAKGKPVFTGIEKTVLKTDLMLGVRDKHSSIKFLEFSRSKTEMAISILLFQPFCI